MIFVLAPRIYMQKLDVDVMHLGVVKNMILPSCRYLNHLFNDISFGSQLLTELSELFLEAQELFWHCALFRPARPTFAETTAK